MFQTLQTSVLTKSLFSDIREVSDGSSCVTETGNLSFVCRNDLITYSLESDDGSLSASNAKRTKFDSSNESLLSVAYDLSNATIDLPTLVCAVNNGLIPSTMPFEAQKVVSTVTITPGASFSRGKYKCRHCGVFKVC